MWLRVLCVTWVLCWSTAANAQTSIDLTLIQDVARAKAEEGLALFAQEQWAQAYERFRLAEELFHAPTLGLHMGHCKRRLGELLAARRHYAKVAAEEVTDDAPPAFRQATEEAAGLVSELDAQIPRLSIEVSGADDVRVTLDGAALASLTDVEVDPGTHRIDVSAPGVEAQSRGVEVAIGARDEIVFALKRTAVPRPVMEPPPPTPMPLPEAGPLWPAFIAYGVGAAGFITGAVAGGIALSRVNTIKSECDETICPDRLLEDAQQAQNAATVANVGFIVGAVGVVVGTVLIIVRPGGEDVSAVGLRVGPTGASFEVSF